MTVLNYMDRQRRRIIERNGVRAGFKDGRTAVAAARDSYEILAEINALEGLNLRERTAAQHIMRSIQSRNGETTLC